MITEVTGDTNMFRAMAYGRPDMLTMDWCRQQEQQHLSLLNEATLANYMAMQNTVFGALDFESIANMHQMLHSQTESGWADNHITLLTEMQQFQAPPPAMIEWIMAMPELREMYHNQQIAGYDEYYTDHDPGLIREDHYHYRRVINGVFPEDGDAVEWFEDLRKPTDDLLFNQQLTIQKTWDNIMCALGNTDKDPTSRFNANR